MAGIVVVLIGMVANIFLQLPALHLAISAVFILISSGAILFETSNIIHGGETNYIRATVSLYVFAVQHLRQPAEHSGLRQPRLISPANTFIASLYAGLCFLLHCRQSD
ncbi:putative carrier/transport protein [Escherichia coli]|uniref:Putative carrier/transport protein n=1 Tax=Escherichia coli TaxID=562 RepID=A0A376LA09_ECOLX|nr:putative carrier/transport protein [Escherichia coli]